jgi:hypothetical protein
MSLPPEKSNLVSLADYRATALRRRVAPILLESPVASIELRRIDNEIDRAIEAMERDQAARLA